MQPNSGLHFIKNSFEVFQDPRFPGAFHIAAGSIIFSDGTHIRVPHINAKAFGQAGATDNGFEIPDGDYVKLTVDKTKSANQQFTDIDPLGCLTVEFVQARTEAARDSDVFVFYLAKKSKGFVNQFVLGDQFVGGGGDAAIPFQIVKRFVNNAWQVSVREFGAADAVGAGRVFPRTGAAVTVTAPAWQAVAEYCYLTIPLKADGDYDVASANMTVEFTGTRCNEFTTVEGVTYRNVEIGTITVNGGECTIRQGWTAGDVHPIDEYGIDKTEVTVYDQVTASDSTNKITQKVRKAKLDVVDGKIKLVYTDASPVTVDVIEVDTTNFNLTTAVSFDATNLIIQKQTTTVNLDIETGKIKLKAGAVVTTDFIYCKEYP